MSYEMMAVIGALFVGALVFLVCALSAVGSWGGCSIAEKLTDGIMIFLIVAVCSGFAYTVIVLHDPARAAAFNPCDHPKPHKRPASCNR